MHDHICSNNTLKGELLEVRVSEKRLLDKIQDLKVDYVKLIGDVLEKVVKQQGCTIYSEGSTSGSGDFTQRKFYFRRTNHGYSHYLKYLGTKDILQNIVLHILQHAERQSTIMSCKRVDFSIPFVSNTEMTLSANMLMVSDSFK
ncbi:hypothetical protein P8452_18135 [Trifolium repens]|nr:hypothetical protein P8452_18135 [Trifolium repens]